jgi:hypothetical protein
MEVPDEELDKHCDSIALAPADEECKEAILIFAPESKAAEKILHERKAGEKKGEKDEAFKKAKTELAKRAEELAAKKAELEAKKAEKSAEK